MSATEAQREFARRTCDFHRCPNTGRVLQSTQGDDKALCSCEQPNPAVPTEHAGCHIKRFLRAATADDFVQQEEARRP